MLYGRGRIEIGIGLSILNPVTGKSRLSDSSFQFKVILVGVVSVAVRSVGGEGSTTGIGRVQEEH